VTEIAAWRRTTPPKVVRPLVDVLAEVLAEVKRARAGTFRHGVTFGSSGSHPAIHVSVIVGRLRGALADHADPDALAAELADVFPERRGHALARELIAAAMSDRPALVIGDAVLARSVGIQLLAALPERAAS
jgi:hypothetical protein